jgi:hypothetical protein
MADSLEQARERAVALADAACPVELADAALDGLEQAVRLSERVAVARRLRSRDWRGGTSIDLDTLDTIIDFILEEDHE